MTNIIVISSKRALVFVLALVVIGSGLPTGTARAATEDLTTGLVFHYSFDSGSNLAADVSGKGNNGTLGGSVLPSATDGKKGGAAYFNRAGESRILLPESAKLGDSYTKSVWVYAPTSSGGGGGFISNPTKTSNQHVFMHSGSNSVVSTNVLHASQPKIARSVPRSQWFHAVTVYDAPSRTLKLFIDGELTDTLENINPVPLAEQTLAVGWLPSPNTTSRGFEGKLDEARVYSRALSTAEVEALYELDSTAVATQVAPTALGVAIEGTAVPGSTLSGTYEYFDADNDPEGDSEFQWLKGTSQANLAPISGADEQTYAVTQQDAGALIVFQVTPKAEEGVIEGTPLASAPVQVQTGSSPQTPTEDITSSLILHYTFDDASQLAKDSSQNAYHGTLNGTVLPTLTSQAVKGSAALFDRAGYSRIEVPSAAVLTDSYTKSAWAYVNKQAGAGGGIISHPTLTAKQHMLMQYGTSAVWAANMNGNAGIRVTAPVTRATWSHVVTTYDAPTRTLKLYVNGELISVNANVNPVVAGERQLMVGALATTGDSRTFDGPLDEVRVYGRALTQAEVSYLYQYDQGAVSEEFAPTASDVTIAGTAGVGNELTGSYTYADADGDAEGTSQLRWISSTTNSPVGGTEVGTGTTYTVTQAEVGTYLFFSVTPVAATGESTGQTVVSAGVFVPAEEPGYTTEDITSGLVFHYGFDDVTNLGRDTSGNGYTGTLGGTVLPIVSSSAIKGTAAFFNRNGYSSIRVPDEAQLGTSYTKSIWAYIDKTAGGGGGFISQPTLTLKQHAFMQYGAASILAANANHATIPRIIHPYQRAGWTHAVARYDATTRVLDLFINGAKVATATNVDPVPENVQNMMVGAFASPNTGSRTFDGPLDEARVYNRALTDAQIAYLFDYDRSSVPAPATLEALELNGRVQLDFASSVGAQDYVAEYRVQGVSTFTTFADGSSVEPRITVTGLANNTTYEFRVFAVRNGIRSEASPVVTGTPYVAAETAPSARNVEISGHAVDGYVLTGEYEYLDLNDDPEGATVMQWFRSSTQNGPFTPIAGATHSTYNVTEGDYGTYLAFQVTPVAASGITTGAAVRSEAVLAEEREIFFHILSTGQSLSTGRAPALSLTQQFDNVTLTPTVDINGVGIDVGPLQPLVSTNDKERPEIPASNTFIGMLRQSSENVRALSTAHGVGGQIYANIKRGTAPYTRALGQIRNGISEVEKLGGIYEPLAVTLVHGESDSALPNLQYAENIAELQHDYEEDMEHILGNDVELPLFFSQASQATPHYSALEQTRAHRTFDKIFLTGPIYQYQFVGDRLHLSGVGSRDLGEQIGKVMYDVLVAGVEWSPVLPTSIVRVGSDVFIKFHVPKPPLAFDTTAVAERVAKGFMFWNGGESREIANVSLFSTDTVKLSLASMPTAGAEEVGYANDSARGSGSHGDPMDPNAYGGNLRDSDTRVAPGTTSSGKALYNWAVAFRDPVTVSALKDVSVTPLTTTDRTPAVSGTVTGPAIGALVTINGQTVSTQVSNGTWTVGDNVLSTLSPGTYDVTVRVNSPEGYPLIKTIEDVLVIQ